VFIETEGSKQMAITYRMPQSPEQLYNIATIAVIHHMAPAPFHLRVADRVNMTNMVIKMAKSQYRSNRNFRRRLCSLLGSSWLAGQMLTKMMPKIEQQYYDEICSWLGERAADYMASEGVIDWDGDNFEDVVVPVAFVDCRGRNGRWKGQAWV
jgi:hypothetical protein